MVALSSLSVRAFFPLVNLPFFASVYVNLLSGVTERRAQEKLLPTYKKRREVLKAIPKFWPVALMNHEMIAINAVHHDDQIALSYLEDVWLVRDPRESRAFTIEFVSRSWLSW